MVSAGGEPRPHYAALDEWLKSISSETAKAKRNEADLIFRRTGITFSLGGEDGGTERLIPSDLVPPSPPLPPNRLIPMLPIGSSSRSAMAFIGPSMA